MPNPNHLIEIPQRVLLSTQVADSLRLLLDQGQWQTVLPSERTLSDQFHVSRPTVRSALQILAKERRLILAKGKRPRIAPENKTAIPRRSRNRKVLLITHQMLSRFSATVYRGVSDMQNYLSKHGVSCEIYYCKTRGLPGQLHKLDQYIQDNDISCCLLATVQKKVQQWFEAKSLPALVFGSCHPSVALPSFDVAHRAVCRHAANILLNKGHRHLAILAPASQGPGDQASVRGFQEAVNSASARASATITLHDNTPENINSRIKTLFASSSPPTGLIVTNPKHTLLVLVQLLRMGLKIPGQVSLISRDQDAIFNELTPKIAHYAFDQNGYTKRLARLILLLSKQQDLSLEPNLIFPDFVPGESIKPVN